MNESKSKALTKSEALKLVDMIAAQEVIFRKESTAGINLLKEAAWIEITDQFNKTVATYPRKPEQIRLKWENLKKTARKRIAKIKVNSIKAEDTIYYYVPPDEVLDTVASLIGLSDKRCKVSHSGSEAADETLVETLETFEESDNNMSHSEKEDPSNITESFSTKNNANQCQSVVKEVKTSAMLRNRAIARYYITKMKNENQLFRLKKRKLELEIFEKEKQLNLSCNNCVKINNCTDPS